MYQAWVERLEALIQIRKRGVELAKLGVQDRTLDRLVAAVRPRTAK
jgi:hypothetical protein